jgi:hypothetical protein
MRTPLFSGNSPIQPTHTLSPATQTATYLPTLVGLSVDYFITNSELAVPGGTVTLFWRVIGSNTARIYRLDAQGNRTGFWEVGAEGRLTVETDPTIPNEARFLLTAERGTAQVEQLLVIPMECTAAWFFQPPPEGECPSNLAIPSLQVEQRFESGLMIWLAVSRQIYVLFADGATPGWVVVADNFQEGLPERDDSFVPPPGLLQPVRGFGLVWREDETLRERIGWALESEIGYDGIWQSSTNEDGAETIYLRLRDGGIIRLLPEGEGWELVPFQNLAPSPSVTPTTES